MRRNFRFIERILPCLRICDKSEFRGINQSDRKHMKLKFYQALAFFAIVLLATSCTSPEYRIFKATRLLEEVEDSQNYSGKIAVSELEFVANKGQFNINYNEDASNYVQAARSNISGEANASVQTAMYVGALLQGSFTAPISAGQPPGTNTPPASQASLPNQAETAINSFSPPPSLTGLTPSADERDAVEKGINDKLAEEFLRFMVNPTVSSNKQAIVFGIMQATCEPGQNTRKGYIAELDVSLSYVRENTNVDEYTTNKDEVDSNIIRIADYDTGRFLYIKTNCDAQLATHIHDVRSNKDYYLMSKTNYEVNQESAPTVLAVLPLMDTRNMALQNTNLHS
jgi:hypothetical protein